MPLLKVIYRQNRLGGEKKYQDDDAVHDVISYCLNPEKTPSGYIGSYSCNIDQPVLEMTLLARTFGKERGLRLRHWILSFSNDEVQSLPCLDVYYELYKIGCYVAQYYASQYQIIFAVHEDSEHPHIHFVMNSVNFVTGKKYAGDKKDYYGFQRYIADFLDEEYQLPLYAVSDMPEYTYEEFFED